MGEKYYIFVGCAEGRFEIGDGPNKGKYQNYYNMFVISPVSEFVSEDYKATGFKAEKFSVVSPAVWKDLTLGEKCSLYFNDKNKVVLASSLGDIIDLQ